MVDVKISGLPNAAALTGNEAIPAVQGGSAVKVLVSAIRAGLASSDGVLARAQNLADLADKSAARGNLLRVASTNTGSSGQDGWWAKFAEVVYSGTGTNYLQMNLLMDQYAVAARSSAVLMVCIRFNSNAAIGGLSLELIAAGSTVPADGFMATVSFAGAKATVSLWVRKPTAFDRPYFYELSRQASSASIGISYFSDALWQAAAPEGEATYSSRMPFGSRVEVDPTGRLVMNVGARLPVSQQLRFGDGVAADVGVITANAAGTAIVAGSAASGTGGLLLRPTGAASVTGQVSLNADGSMIFGGLSAAKLATLTSLGAVNNSGTESIGGTKTFQQYTYFSGGLAADNTITIRGDATGAARLMRIGGTRTADGPAYFDLVAEANRSDYNTRFYRSSGIDGDTNINHRGAGVLALNAENAGSISLRVSGASKLLVMADRVQAAVNVLPAADNSLDLGAGATRFANLYVVNAPITGSDKRMKKNLRHLSDAEEAAFLAIAELESVWEWKIGDRIHGGPTVQDARDVMLDHGLDPWAYSCFCHDSWPAKAAVWREWPAQDEVWEEWSAQEAVYEVVPATYGDEGQVVTPETHVMVSPAVEAGRRLISEAVEAGRELVEPAVEAGESFSFRVGELHAWMLAAMARRDRREREAAELRLANIEQRLAVLESGK